MSLAINIDKVREVLLADGWHKVRSVPDEPSVSSFDIDSYEYVDKSSGERGGIIRFEDGLGASWLEGTKTICVPMRAILAVRQEETKTARMKRLGIRSQERE